MIRKEELEILIDEVIKQIYGHVYECGFGRRINEIFTLLSQLNTFKEEYDKL